MAQTLWERLTKGPEVLEDKRYNPLKLRIGSGVNINLADFHGLMFFLHELREVSRVVNGNKHQFTDYMLVSRTKGPDVMVRLRVSPGQDADDILLLNLWDEKEFDKDLHQILTTDTEFHITKDAEEDVFWRVGDVEETQHGEVVTLNEQLNGVKTQVVSSESNIDYWDYSRMTNDAANQEYVEMLFVELDKDNGRFEIWRGRKIEPNRISKF